MSAEIYSNKQFTTLEQGYALHYFPQLTEACPLLAMISRHPQQGQLSRFPLTSGVLFVCFFVFGLLLFYPMTNKLENVTIRSAIATQTFHLPHSIYLLPCFSPNFNRIRARLVSVVNLSLAMHIVCIMQCLSRAFCSQGLTSPPNPLLQ